MSWLWITVVALGSPVFNSDPAAEVLVMPAEQADEWILPPRTPAELRQAVHRALRRWAKVSNAEAEEGAREFLALFAELQRDERMAPAQREELLGKVRGRLAGLAQQINKQIASEKRLNKGQQPESVAAADNAPVLAQWGGGAWGGRPGGGGAGGAWGGGPGWGGAGGAWGGGPAWGGGGQGWGGAGATGPAGLGGAGLGGPGGAPVDYGPELVDLIQRTISPPSWQVNGGLGTIYYWRPGRALVIRQTGEIHGQIGDVLQQMQRGQ